MIDLIKVLISLTILVKAGMDYLRVREVSDKLWIIMALSSIPLNAVQYISNGFDLFYLIVQFAIVFFHL